MSIPIPIRYSRPRLMHHVPLSQDAPVIRSPSIPAYPSSPIDTAEASQVCSGHPKSVHSCIPLLVHRYRGGWPSQVHSSLHTLPTSKLPPSLTSHSVGSCIGLPYLFGHNTPKAKTDQGPFA